ncbi:MAG: hypothetical protein QXO75_07590 [Nitrososphaerota archaeon]
MVTVGAKAREKGITYQYPILTEDGYPFFMIAKESINKNHIIMFSMQLLSETDCFPYVFRRNAMIE